MIVSEIIIEMKALPSDAVDWCNELWEIENRGKEGDAMLQRDRCFGCLNLRTVEWDKILRELEIRGWRRMRWWRLWATEAIGSFAFGISLLQLKISVRAGHLAGFGPGLGCVNYIRKWFPNF